MNTLERYERVLRYLAKENIPEGFGNVELDLHDLAYGVAVKREGTPDVDDVTEEDYFEGLLQLVERAIKIEQKI